jgi:hypothetical protein
MKAAVFKGASREQAPKIDLHKQSERSIYGA